MIKRIFLNMVKMYTVYFIKMLFSSELLEAFLLELETGKV